MSPRFIASVTQQIGTIAPLRCECGQPMQIAARNEDQLTTDWVCSCGKRWRVADVSVQADEVSN